jgi:hypothetical protein
MTCLILAQNLERWAPTGFYVPAFQRMNTYLAETMNLVVDHLCPIFTEEH